MAAGEIYVYGERRTDGLIQGWRIEAEDRAAGRRGGRSRLNAARWRDTRLVAVPADLWAPDYSWRPEDHPAGRCPAADWPA